MKLQLEKSSRDWQAAALGLTALMVLLVWADTVFWHVGYAYGDETDIVAAAQRLREGMPFSWDILGGSLHRWALLASMSLWPGRLWAPSVPAMAALAVEACLLFAVGRRLGGPRAGFFAVLAGLVSCFTLVRARACVSLSLFPAEWLILVWLRIYCRRPWAWLMWGVGLGFCCFDYEAWAPTALLFLLLPFLEPLSWRQRAWEGLGLLAAVAVLLPPGTLAYYVQRRENASLLQPKSGSAGWDGFKGLVFGGRTLPYLAPLGFAVLPAWDWLLWPLGLSFWPKRWWVPLAYVALGVALPLMGGAPFGLPAHRAVALWPALALLMGLALDRIAAQTSSSWGRAVFALLILAVASQQLWAWQFNQNAMDPQFRGPMRDLKRAAAAGWEQSLRMNVPLVTELHPMLGAQFRFLTGHAVPLPDASADTVVAFLPCEYFSAVRKHTVAVATFQETAGYEPAMVAILTGPLAKDCVSAERDFRPLLLKAPTYSQRSSRLVFEWLRENRTAGIWNRTLAVDYLMNTAWYGNELNSVWIENTYREPLVSAHPLLVAAHGAEDKSPETALKVVRRARGIDPYNGDTWVLERSLLVRLKRDAEVTALDKAEAPYQQKSLLFAE
jgi:hypothetical protein